MLSDGQVGWHRGGEASAGFPMVKQSHNLCEDEPRGYLPTHLALPLLFCCGHSHIWVNPVELLAGSSVFALLDWVALPILLVHSPKVVC